MIFLSDLEIGIVIEANGFNNKIATYDNTNHSSFISNGEIVKNISVNSFMIIKQGFIRIVARINSETIWDTSNINKYNISFDNRFSKKSIKRILEVQIVGYIKNNVFHNGSSYLPMIGNPCIIPNENDINLIYINNYSENERHLVSIGKSLIEQNTINLPVNLFFASHIGIFGNTGSGKSNTLHKLYYELFNLNNLPKMKENSKFLILDFNDEYTQPLSFGLSNDGINKLTHNLDSSNSTTGQKFPIQKNHFLNEEILSILFQATQQTQKPFLSRVIKSIHRYGTGSISLANWIVSQLTTILNSEPNKDIFNRLLNILEESFSDITCHTEILRKIQVHSKNGCFYLENPQIYFNGTMDSYRIKSLRLTDIRAYIEASELDLIDEFKIRCKLQLVTELLYGSIVPEHIEPLIKRIDTRLRSIKNYIKLVDELPSQPFLQIVSLKSLNQEAKKIVSLLITKMYFDKHKKANVINNKSFHLIVDEAHNILSSQSVREQEGWKDYRLELFEEIIKEGRKFSFFLTISSQRPADISPTILSQVHNFFLHKLVNEKDLQIIDNSISTLDKISKSMLPILSQGVCIISGTAITMSIPVSIDFIEDNTLRPKSDTIQLTDIWE
ncbi:MULTISPECIES: ATP-binding protein [unclassified Enterococcus]|uniref:ATP-binding protein n=1 Tax=unclassified Enterococcus TaxID=2608891 RepID=UPI00259BE25B|nr:MULTISPECIES: ATP-binding protein [unclassified Enterococcus]MDO0919921.1 ATP-binding protein [Enterococcus sp. B1E2]WIV15393.1 ATP-binding protein [Enterococcus sp. FZMF]